MKHVIAYLAGVVCFAIGAVALWFNRAALATSIPLMLFIGFWFLMALLLVARAEATEAIQAIVVYLPDSLVGGKRKTDPPKAEP